MRRLLRLGCVALAAAAIAAVTTLAPASARQAAAGTSSACTSTVKTVEVDPRGLLPLPANAKARATTAALLFLGRAVTPKIYSARLATADRANGLAAKAECGTQIWQRTVVVRVQLCSAVPARFFYVGRFENGYHVWQVAS